MGWWLGFCWLVRQNRLADFLRHPLVGISHQPAALSPCSHVCWPSVPASSASSFFLSLFLRASLACFDSGALSLLSLGHALEATDTPLQAESRRARGAKLADRVRSSGPGG